MSDDQPGAGVSASGTDGGYEAPSVSVYETAAPTEWAALTGDEAAADDLLAEGPSSDASPEVKRWSAPKPEYEYADPEVFIAPADPSRKVSGKTKVVEKTKKAGMKTVAVSKKVKITGKDAFGGSICTCDVVCTCDQVCTCEAVCSCDAQGGGGGGGGGPVCGCNPQGCSSDCPDCACQAQPY